MPAHAAPRRSRRCLAVHGRPVVRLVCAAALVVAGSGWVAAPAYAATAPTTFAELQSAVDDSAQPTVALGADINVTDTSLLIPTDHQVTLDLDGHHLTIAQTGGVQDQAHPGYAPVYVPVGADLTIEDTGSGGTLHVEGFETAGIGGGSTYWVTSPTVTAGSVTILGGAVTATARFGGAGIGGGTGPGGGGNGGTVTVSGGTVTATGDLTAAGIGGGDGYQGGGSGGSVTVTGGTVMATGGGGAAGIGGGEAGAGGSLTVSGGSVTATGGDSAAGIGRGTLASGAAGSVAVSGGTVTATGGAYGPGINAGGGGSDGSVMISGGTVTATGGSKAAGIGGYSNSGGGLVTVTGGSVTAAGGSSAPGIGSPAGTGGSLTIGAAGSVTAVNGSGASSIGSGNPALGYPSTLSLSNAGSLTIPAGSRLMVPPTSAVENSGVLHLGGTLSGLVYDSGTGLVGTGAGTVHNAGSILTTQTSPTGTVAGDGLGPAGSSSGAVMLVSEHNYGLSFDVNGGTGAAPSPERVFAASLDAAGLSLPAGPTPPSDRHFTGWFTAATGGTQVTGSTDLSTLAPTGPSSLTLFAHYAANSYTVSFDAAGGSPAPAAQTVDDGGHATEPTAPDKTGYTFSGWYTAAGDLFDFASAITGDVTLTARYAIDSYTVSFDAAGGSPTPTAQTVDYGGHATEPTAPGRTGYTFTGWDTAAGDRFDFNSDTVTSDLTLTARYTEITLTVTDANGTVIAGGSQVSRDQQVTVTVTGLEPGTDYAVTARSAPIRLATFTTDATGAGHATVTIPVTLDAGAHHLTVDTTGAGSATVASFAFTLPAGPTPTPASPAPTSGPSSTVSVVSSGSSTAQTGSDVAALVTLAGLLLALGIGLVAAFGRRPARD